MKPQLAKHLHIEMGKKNPACVGVQYSVFEKYDGWFGYMEIGDVIRSRAGREIPAIAWLSRLINKSAEYLPKGTLIFEILLHDVIDFPTLNGILNRSVGDCNAYGAYLRVHDFLEEEPLPFLKRYQTAERVIKSLGLGDVVMAPRIGCSRDPEVWNLLVKRVWDNGGEGIILKDNKAFYEEGKRNSSILKIKEDITLDLVVVDLIEGEGKYKGTLGALVVEDSEGYHHTVSGMTDLQRYEWWKKPTNILGNIVEVKAMKRLADGSLREPRFKAVRYDKAEGEID